MAKDIESNKDVEHLVDHFYESVRKDPLIGYIFDDVIKVNWETHLPKIYAFWESILFGSGTFRGNPLLKHIVINEKIKLTETHFDRWLHLWENTIDKNFAGKNAEVAKKQANLMKQLMLFKIRQSENSDFIQ